MRYQGKIIKWNDEKGFGFVVPKGGSQSVFVHVRAFSNRQRRPVVDATINYELESDAQGRCCAVNVRYADEKQATVELRISVVPLLLVIAFSTLLIFLESSGRIPMAVAILYLAASLVTFMAYALDKSAAKSGQWRTQESTLFLMGLAGGWPGAVLAQQLFRHKSSKRDFQTFFWLTVIVNSGAFFWLVSPNGTDMRLLLDGMT
jgi:uncharacterized membrane protein YsdA (DUF1294 family)/cold shock CspA family protein